MIKFINGKFLGGDITNIISYDFEYDGNWWDYHVNDDCYILHVSKNKTETLYFNTSEFGINFIPEKESNKDEFWSLFWESELTIIFESKEFGIDCMNKYLGHCVEHVRTLGKEILSLGEIEIFFTSHFKLTNNIDFTESYPNEELYIKILNLFENEEYRDLRRFVTTLNQVSSDLEKLI